MLKDLKRKQATIDNLSATIATLQDLIDSTIKSDPLLQNQQFLETLVQIETDEEIQEKNRGNVAEFFYNNVNNDTVTALTNPDMGTNVETLYHESKELINSVARFAGVQAMVGPVGLSYALSYETKMKEPTDDIPPVGALIDSVDTTSSGLSISPELYTITLEVKSKAVEACSRRIPEDATTTEAINDMIVSIILNNCKRTTIASDTTSKVLQAHLHMLGSDIARNTRRGAGNILMCSEATQAKFKPSTSYNRTAIINNSVPDNIIIVGYVGTSNMDCGIFFAPYMVLKRKVINEEYVPINQDIIRYGLSYNNNWENYYQILEIVDAE